MRFLKENDTGEHTLTRQANITNRNEKETIIIDKGGNIPRVLNTNDKNELVECMNELVKTKIGQLTNWDIAVIIWDKGNPQAQIPNDIEMLNYLDKNNIFKQSNLRL